MYFVKVFFAETWGISHTSWIYGTSEKRRNPFKDCGATDSCSRH